MLCDSHAHLESSCFDGDRAEVIMRACRAGVTRIVTCGSDVATSRAGIALAAAYPPVSAAVGIHGHRADSAVAGDGTSVGGLNESIIDSLRSLAGAAGVVAIGEIGLDYHYEFSARVNQCAVLERQLALAGEMGLPVILHSREADADMRALIEAAPAGLRGVFHCFLSDAAVADWALGRGFHLGIGGPITFRNVNHLPEIVRRAPLERLLVETDSPYLAPHPHRGQRNEPAWVGDVVVRVASLRGLTPAELGEATYLNAARLFAWT